MFTVHHSSVDSLLSRKSFAAQSAYFDVEPHASGFALVMRGSDKAIVGKTDDTSQCKFVFNREDGAPIDFILATGDDADELQEAADGLIYFYTSLEPYSARASALGDCGLAVLPLAIAAMGFYSRERNRHTEIKTGWQVGSYWGILESSRKAEAALQLMHEQERKEAEEKLRIAGERELAKRAKEAAKIERAARILSSAAAQSAALPITTTPEMRDMVAALMRIVAGTGTEADRQLMQGASAQPAVTVPTSHVEVYAA